MVHRNQINLTQKETLFFLGEGKNLAEQSREAANSSHLRRRIWESNGSHQWKKSAITTVLILHPWTRSRRGMNHRQQLRFQLIQYVSSLYKQPTYYYRKPWLHSHGTGRISPGWNFVHLGFPFTRNHASWKVRKFRRLAKFISFCGTMQAIDAGNFNFCGYLTSKKFNSPSVSIGVQVSYLSWS